MFDKILSKLKSGNGKIIDLTYTCENGTPFWPGTEPFKLENIIAIEQHGLSVDKLSLTEHAGTHLDAPAHFKKGGADVSDVQLQGFMGPAAVIDISAKAETNPDYELSVDDLAEWEKKNGELEKGSIVLMMSGWSKRWPDQAKFTNTGADGKMHFPGFSPELVKFLLDKRDVKGIGVDTLSTDRGIDSEFKGHNIWLKAGKFSMETMANLDKLPAKGAFLIAAPMKIKGGGAPVRVFAVLP